MSDLRDFLLARQGELSDLLAGYAVADPGFVVELTSKLRPEHLTDINARRFLLALTPDANPLETARSMGLEREYPRWMTIAADNLYNLQQAAMTTVDEIKRLVVCRQALTELSTWLAEAARIGRHS